MTKKHPVKSQFFVAKSDVSLALGHLGHPGARRGSYSPEVMPQAKSTGLEQLTEKHMNIFWNKHEQIGYGMLASIFEKNMSATFIMHIHAAER